MQNFNLSDLELQNAGSWPKEIKLASFILLFVIAVLIGYMLFIKDKGIQLEQVKSESMQLQNTLEKKAIQAANLPIYREQLATIENNFAKVLRQLPKDTEIPGLLDDISHAGTGNGLNFKSITLKSEQVADFYLEIPMELVVEGRYHELGSFISAIASLPRIVTLHDFSIEPIVDSNQLNLTVLAKTYRYDEGGQDENMLQDK